MQAGSTRRRFPRVLLLSALLATLLARPPGLAAQEGEEGEFRSPWRTNYFPYLSGKANDGPVFSARIRYWQPAAYEARTTYAAALDGAAGVSFRGTRYAAVRFRAPGLWKDWRLDASLVAERLARFGYFGLGNDTEHDRDLVGEETPFLFRVRRIRYEGRVEVTRRIQGPFHVALRGDLGQARFTTLPGPSVFINDFGEGIEEDDVSGRLALIYDTRDNEYNTHQGLLLEAGTEAGTGGDNYSRQYAIFRGYLQVREGTVLAGRLAGAGMGGTSSLDARFALPGWEKEVPVLGGQFSHRGLDYGRLTGRGVLFGNFEVRHDLLPFGDLGAVTVVAFLDAGRVFEQEGFKLTTKDMKVGGGGAIALRILRSTILAFNFGGGPDGFQFSVGNGWMF